MIAPCGHLKVLHSVQLCVFSSCYFLCCNLQLYWANPGHPGGQDTLERNLQFHEKTFKSLAITGTPKDKASTSGNPYPSAKVGNNNARAWYSQVESISSVQWVFQSRDLLLQRNDPSISSACSHSQPRCPIKINFGSGLIFFSTNWRQTLRINRWFFRDSNSPQYDKIRLINWHLATRFR